MTLQIFAKPNAKRTALVKVMQNELHISLHAQPKEGEANKELIRFLSELFDIPKSQITLEKGATGRYKRVSLPLTEKVKALLKS